MRVDCAAGPNNPTKPTKEGRAMNDDIDQRRTGKPPSGEVEEPCIYTASEPKPTTPIEQLRQELGAIADALHALVDGIHYVQTSHSNSELTREAAEDAIDYIGKAFHALDNAMVQLRTSDERQAQEEMALEAEQEAEERWRNYLRKKYCCDEDDPDEPEAETETTVEA